MISSLSPVSAKRIALFGLAALGLLVSLGAMPHQARAADPAASPATLTVVSSNASTTLAKVGDTLTYTLVIGGGDTAPVVAPQIKLTGLASTTMVGSGRSYSYATTTYSSGISEGPITFQMSVGGSGIATSTFSQANLTGTNVTFDKTAPTINSITSSATAGGVLKVGDTITFTLSTSSVERYGSVTGSYNGRSLSWALTGVSTFVATYTVTEGDTDQGSALQISGVILRDAAGNPSTATAGSDIAKTIDANSPATPTPGVAAGSYSDTQSVTLSSTGSNSIRYTTDGSSPTCSVGTVYSGAITVSATETIKAIGCDTAGNLSSVASFDYTIEAASHSRRSGGGGGHVYTTTGVPTPTTPTAPVAPTTPISGSVSAGAFARSLQVGMTGDDVKALQMWLNAHGFAVAVSGVGSAGMETMTFGGLTKAAVARFQAANGITPAVGFFGPITRAAVAAMQ